MIHIILGTKAQLIKMAPVIREFANNEVPYNFIYTGQHKETINDILDNFQIQPPDITLYSGDDITSVPKMMVWSIFIISKTLTKKVDIFKGDKKGIVLVHGDTFSTLLGALMGKLAGLKVGHVESGLLSNNLLHPFPEEITRVIVFRLSNYMFCPGEWAVDNLSKYKGKKINMEHNTLCDAFNLALPKFTGSNSVLIPDQIYAVISLHRFENIFSKAALERVVKIVEWISKKYFLVFILHKPTDKKLNQFNLYQRLESNPNIELRPRYDYFKFIQLISGSKFVVSDGGSNQEECYYLGKPILLLRRATERQEGLNKNCVLSEYSMEKIEKFLDNLENYQFPIKKLETSPSKIVVEHSQFFS